MSDEFDEEQELNQVEALLRGGHTVVLQCFVSDLYGTDWFFMVDGKHGDTEDAERLVWAIDEDPRFQVEEKRLNFYEDEHIITLKE